MLLRQITPRQPIILAQKDLQMDLSNTRQEYASSAPLDGARCPYTQFETWYKEAERQEVIEPNAMVLCTVGDNLQPSQRTVLLKTFDHQGFVFFTNYSSRKAKQIAENPQVSLLFPWLDLKRQVEISGIAKKIPTAESLRYFVSRPRGSQLGAWVSRQSEVISNSSILQSKLAELKQKFSKGKIPLPSSWGGFRVHPQRFEFWQGRGNRLHDRLEYLPNHSNSSPSGPPEQSETTWIRQQLSP